MDLSLNELRRANIARAEELANETPTNTPFAKGEKGSSNWTILEFCGAMAGEAGEAANVAKKIRRGKENLTQELAEELADTLIYIDMCALKMGIDLSEAVIKKFNEKSQKWGCNTRINSYPICD